MGFGSKLKKTVKKVTGHNILSDKTTSTIAKSMDSVTNMATGGAFGMSGLSFQNKDNVGNPEQINIAQLQADKTNVTNTTFDGVSSDNSIKSGLSGQELNAILGTIIQNQTADKIAKNNTNNNSLRKDEIFKILGVGVVIIFVFLFLRKRKIL